MLMENEGKMILGCSVTNASNYYLDIFRISENHLTNEHAKRNRSFIDRRSFVSC